MTSKNQYRQKLWKKILASGVAMEKAAHENDWPTLNTLIENRLKLLQKFFAEPVANFHQENLRQIQTEIEIILDQDEQTRQLSSTNQGLVAESLKRLKQSKNAIKNYQT